MRSGYRSVHRTRRKRSFPNTSSVAVLLLAIGVILFWPAVRALLSSYSESIQQNSRQYASELFGDWLTSLKIRDRESLAGAFKDLIFLPESRTLDVNHWSVSIPENFVEIGPNLDSASGLKNESGQVESSPIRPVTFQGAAHARRDLVALERFEVRFHQLPETKRAALWRLRISEVPYTAELAKPNAVKPPPAAQEIERLASEMLEIEAIVLSPGESVILSPSESEPGDFFEQHAHLNIICLGATADRLDSPGRLLIRTFTADEQSGTLQLGEQVSSDVSHRQELSRISLPGFAPSNGGGVVITWDKGSSGNLLILGTESAQNLRPTESQVRQGSKMPARLLVSTKEIASTSSLLPNLFSALQEHEAMQSREEKLVWPAHSDPVQSQIRGLEDVSRSVARESVAWNRVEMISGAKFLTNEEKLGLFENRSFSSLGIRFRHALTFESYENDPEGTEEVWASTLRAGIPLNLHIDGASQGPERADSLVLGRIDDLLSGEHRSFQALRSLTIFGKDDDWLNAPLEENARVIDKVLTSIHRRLSGVSMETLVQAMNVSKRQGTEIDSLDSLVPEGFEPGWGLLLNLNRGEEIPEWNQIHPMGLEQSKFYDFFFSNVQEPVRKSSRKSDELVPVARISGSDGRLYVFESGWIYLPNVGEGAAELNPLSEPVYGLPLGELSRAKEAIFAAESDSDEKVLHFRVPVPKTSSASNAKGSFVLDIRSEDPLFGCSASDESVNFRHSFSHSDGWMFVKVEFDANIARQAQSGIRELEIACLIELGKRNPVPKKRTGEKPDESEAGKNISLTVRASWDGARLPLEEIRLGPYFEPAQLMMSERAIESASLRFDLRSDGARLSRIVPELAQGVNTKGFDFWISAANEFPTGHLQVQRWDEAVQDFIKNRLEYSQAVREN